MTFAKTPVSRFIPPASRFITPVSRKARGKFAESPRMRCGREEKNAKQADSRAVERNWSFPTAPGFPPSAMDIERSSSAFTDTSTECAICLTPFDDSETIVLTCGHRWHLECLTEQLRHAQPIRSRRILFSGCRCAKCNSFCDHDALRHLTRRTDALRDEVDDLIAEQMRIDAPRAWEEAERADDGGTSRTSLLEGGRRTYAFYLCGSCEGPYFGGTIECADREEGELPSIGAGQLCPSCAPQSHAVCRHPTDHRAFHVWKCRYCCRPASHVCYGTVHFCDRCHDRNSKRVRLQQQRQREGTSANRSPLLEAIRCSGGSCQRPKSKGQEMHANGPSHDCEQVYHCAWCESAPYGRRDAVDAISGSRNFIVNPSGELGMHGWRQLNRQLSWRVERSEIPASASARSNFVSGFQWCVMAQTVPLHTLVNDPSSVRIEVSAKFMGRTDCPSIFRLEALVLDAQRRERYRVSTSALDTPADFWERSSLVIEPVPGAHNVVMVVYGKDQRFWQGSFGSKVAECSVRVLCHEDEIENIICTGKKYDCFG